MNTRPGCQQILATSLFKKLRCLQHKRDTSSSDFVFTHSWLQNCLYNSLSLSISIYVSIIYLFI
jgi:hypothetical protein